MGFSFLSFVTDGLINPFIPAFVPFNPDQDLCNIGGMIVDINGKPVPNAEINLSIFGWVSGTDVIVGRPAFYPPSLIHAMPKSVYTDSSGIFTAPLLRKTVVKIDIPRTGYYKLVRIPDAPSAAFDQLEIVKP